MTERPITVAQLNFRRHAHVLEPLDTRGRFTHIFEANLWGSDSRSGSGSESDQTAALRTQLARFGVRSLLDLPCGDFGWLSDVDLGVDSYIGADIVAEIVARDTAAYDRDFRVLDLTADPLPQADLVLCRDCLVHFSDNDIWRAVENLKRSGSRYLLTTTFLDLPANTDISTGDWRPLNLRQSPFDFGAPLAVLVEGCTELDGAYADKALALWDIAALPQRTTTSGSSLR
jgi:hypothetical protein